MKKTIALLLAFTTVLCLALAGCGATTDIPVENENNLAEQTISLENTGNSEASSSGAAGSTSGIDNKNPQQDADGMYVYEVRGHEVKLSFNIWDYIGTEKTDNYFRLTSLAKDFGFDEKYNYDGLFMNKKEDGSHVFVGFQQHFSEQTTEIYIGASSGPQLAGPQVGVGYTYYDLDKMDYVYDGQKTPISLEFMILCAYAVEHNAEEFHKDTFDTILEDYRMTESGHSFALPSPEQ